jgi:hypothetical protein
MLTKSSSALIALLLSRTVQLTASVVCGTDYANFDPDGVALPIAVQCVLNPFDCDSDKLPPDARGANSEDSSKVLEYYGPNISEWCVGQVEVFDNAFNGAYPVSAWICRSC